MQVRPHLVESVAPVLGVAVTELARLVPAPALHVRRLEEGAHVVPASVYGDGVGTEVGHGHRVANLVRGVALVRGGAYAELPVRVVPPAGDLRVVEEGAGEVVARGDLNGGPARRQGDLHEAVPHPPGLVADRCG